ncbi:MAG: glutamate--cysteine ligase [Rhodoferax sp.]
MTESITALDGMDARRLRGIRRGIEKESLSCTPDGVLAQTPHPAPLGSALTHPHITTDFSESQIELITGVHAGVESCLDELRQVQKFTLQAMGREALWVSSMPCELPGDDAIPLGQYGRSNVGQAKTVYRSGLGYRYGRRMQTISGIHYNWSLPDVSSEAYFGLIRNFRRHAFLLLYLFGASPAVCESFVARRTHSLQAIGPGTMGLPFATSLRMGRLGYQSDAQSALAVSYNSLEGYAASLHQALTVPYAPYQDIGVQAPDGHFRQLASTLLQTENEFYGTIRPKRVIFQGERPLHALRERGVEYVEVRLMDLDPFEPVGINAGTLRFLDVFLLHCLSQPSPKDSPQEIAAMSRNQQCVAERGREPGLQLQRGEARVTLKDWGLELVREFAPIAKALDAAHGSTDYSAAVAHAEQRLHHPEALPSARVLQAMQEEFGGSFAAFAKAHSLQTKAQELAAPLEAHAFAHFEQLADDSRAQQRTIEESDSLPFAQYLAQYLQPERLGRSV